MKFVIFFLFFVGNLFYVTAQQKVVGGVSVDIKDYPWQVAVDYGCGGSIIGDSWVLTAAHCVGGGVNYIYAGNSAPYASGGETYAVNQVVVHPNYGSGISYSHDFALVEINGEFNFDNPNIGKIDLITPGEVLAGSENPGVTTTITGWGTLSSGGTMAPTLQMVQTPLVANDVACGATIDSNGNSGGYPCSSLDESMVCAGDLINGGEDACQGDSGGPLAVRSVVDNRWLLIGATSWGYGCADVNYPGVWSKVSYVYDWIINTADVTNYNNDLSIANLDIDYTNCGSVVMPSVEIANVGAFSVSGTEIQLFLDDIFIETISWQDSIIPNQIINPELPILNNLEPGYHNLEIILQSDDQPLNNALSIEFNLFQFLIGEIDFTLYLDQQPGQVSWELLDNNGYMLYNGSGYGIALGVETEFFDLSTEACYTFNIFDSNGSSNSLSYSLSANGSTISGSNFGDFESVSFYVGEIYGCTDPIAVNYNPGATQSDYSCIFTGCTNVLAYNYNPQASQEDGSCIFYGCMDSNALNYDSQATEDDGSCELITSQEIILPQGWSIFSSYIQAEDMNLVSLMSNIQPQIVIVKNYMGTAYIPNWDFNGIGNLEYNQGYQVKTTQTSTIIIEGEYVDPLSNVLYLAAGWNIISYLRLESAAADLVFYDLVVSDNIVIAKDDEGFAYLPEWNYNGIGNLEPGKGYQIKTNTLGEINYLPNNMEY